MLIIAFQKFCSNIVVNVSKRYKSSGKRTETKMQVFLQKRNSLTGSSDWEVGIDQDEYDYHQEIARSAFADMLHDTERNKMYYRALQLAIEKMQRDGKKANVLDIGTGTGLLSMMAAKCGADTITACEAFKPMAECCQKIIKQNEFADKIKLIPKRSTEITVGEGGDMEHKANILVTEVFDTELIGEGALGTFSHAHEHLLERECIVVPDAGVVYAQVVECAALQRWNKLLHVDDPELGFTLLTPHKMARCAGSAAVHDLQLSQLPRTEFRELSPALPVLYYDWSGRSPLLKNRLVKQQFSAEQGTAHAVFMWWELNMDTEGKIVLSCAPWWAHPAADAASAHPGDSLPWRDHWMQAVYYLPAARALNTLQETTLVACQDEYSLWFYLEEGAAGAEGAQYRRPVCECGVHMAWSRTHLAYLNDPVHAAPLRRRLKEDLTAHSVVLDLNGSSFLGLLAAKIAKKVFIHETSHFNINILQDYMKANDIKNVEFVQDFKDEVLGVVTDVIFDPVRSSSILPWEDLKSAYLLHRCRERLGPVRVTPASFSLWCVPVEFLQLHKIRVPVASCEGFDVSIFDELVERARDVSDAALEAQPLWEYPCASAGRARRLLTVQLDDLQHKYAVDGSLAFSEWSGDGEEPEFPVNGFALWVEWDAGGAGGAARGWGRGAPRERLTWDAHTKQAVHILKHRVLVKASQRWSYQVACDLAAGHFDVSVRLQDEP